VWRDAESTTVFPVDEDGFMARQAEMAALLDSNWRVFDAHTPVALLVAGVRQGVHDAWVPVANRSQAVYTDAVHLHPYVYRGARAAPFALLYASLLSSGADTGMENAPGLNELFLLQLIGDSCSDAFTFSEVPWGAHTVGRGEIVKVAEELRLY